MPFSEDELLPISALQHLEFCPRRLRADPYRRDVDGKRPDRRRPRAPPARASDGRRKHRRRPHGPRPPALLPRTGPVRRCRCRRVPSPGRRAPGVARLPRVGNANSRPIAQCCPTRRPLAAVSRRIQARQTQAGKILLRAALRQALCLEEMLKIEVPAGALYHGQSRRRQEVDFDAACAAIPANWLSGSHELIAAGRPPPPEYGPKCKFCSLMPQCVPKLPPSRSASDYWRPACAKYSAMPTDFELCPADSMKKHDNTLYVTTQGRLSAARAQTSWSAWKKKPASACPSTTWAASSVSATSAAARS